MSINDSFTLNQNTFQTSEINLPRQVRFWLLLLLNIPSVFCSFLVLYHLFNNKTLRWQLTNHVMIVLLIIGLFIQLVNITFYLAFLQFGSVQPSVPITCLILWFIDLGIYNGCTVIIAWGAIHRYLVIFYDRLFLNQRKRLIFHYLPIFLILVYIVVFNVIVIFFPSCVNTYDYTLPVCNDFPCYLNDPFLGTWDSIANNIIPVVILIIFSIALLIRITRQKRRLRQRNLWNKQRKMTVQLLCVCILYLIPNLPQNIFVFAHLCGLSRNVGVQAQLYFSFLCYFVTLIYPFICLDSLTELRKKIHWRGFLLLKQPRQIAIIKPY